MQVREKVQTFLHFDCDFIREQAMTKSAFPAQFPDVLMRRMRKDAFSRAMMRENVISAADLIYPVFITEGKNHCEKVASMPGVERLSVDLLLGVAEECVSLGIPVMALFPVINPSLK